MPSLRLGIDIGGTFTDLALHDTATGRCWTGKVLTTPADLTRAVVDGMRQVLAEAGIAARALAAVIHATTQASNTVIERSGAACALITTEGFRDILEMGREARYDVYDLFLDLPAPLVPRRLRLEVQERREPDGRIRKTLRGSDVRRIARLLARERVEAVAVCLLHSYANPRHEREVRRLLKAAGCQGPIILSSDVCPEIREYERTVTTTVNAYLAPKMQGYLRRFQKALREEGSTAPVHVMSSSGGYSTISSACARPVELLESGPAAGALAAAATGRQVGWRAAISFDMGGTTAKTALIHEGEPSIARMYEVARMQRFTRGSGLPILSSAVELMEIGAGGGSIAWVDALGLLKVGPQSAGSEPGPACYGRGGMEPTVTDADMLLGYLDPKAFLGGTMRLDWEAAIQAIERHVAKPLGIGVTEAAWGIYNVITESMARASRVHIVERGHDPRRFGLIAFGGAGPVHAAALAERLGVADILVPAKAGVISALGLLAAPPVANLVETYLTGLVGANWKRVKAIFTRLEREARRTLALSEAAPLTCVRSADMRYHGQGHEIAVRLPDRLDGAGTGPAVEAAFNEAYRRLYDRHNEGAPIEILNWRLTAIGPAPETRGSGNPSGSAGSDHGGGRRPVWFGAGWVETPVVQRDALTPGDPRPGPALVEERETTTVVPPGALWWLDSDGNLRIRVETAGGSA